MSILVYNNNIDKKVVVSGTELIYVYRFGNMVFEAPRTPVVYNGDSVALSPSSIRFEGNISDIGTSNVIKIGVRYSTNSNLSGYVDIYENVNYSYPQEFSITVTGLSQNTTYYFKMYATNYVGEDEAGVIDSVATPPVVTSPSVSEPDATADGPYKLDLTGYISSNGGDNIIEYGFYYKKVEDASYTKVIVGTNNKTGYYYSTLSSLDPDTEYRIYGYAKNSSYTGTSSVVSGFTDPIPIVAPTVYVSSATADDHDSITVYGYIDDNGGASINDYGFYWKVSGGSYAKKQVGTNNKSGSYQYQFNGLTPNTTYYFYAYAKNTSNLTGDDSGSPTSEATDPATAPTVITDPAQVSGYGTSATISLGGEVTSWGSGSASSYGIRYKLSSSGTWTNLSCSNLSSGVFSVSPDLTGISAGTYDYQAYATSSVGVTGYGDSNQFTVASAPSYSISVSPSGYAQNQGGDVQVTVTSSHSWNATVNKGDFFALSISASSGVSGDTPTISIPTPFANGTYNGNVTFTCGTATRVFHISVTIGL